nr:hypothetical protein [Angustibacter aerolatus]
MLIYKSRGRVRGGERPWPADGARACWLPGSARPVTPWRCWESGSV